MTIIRRPATRLEEVRLQKGIPRSSPTVSTTRYASTGQPCLAISIDSAWPWDNLNLNVPGDDPSFFGGVDNWGHLYPAKIRPFLREFDEIPATRSHIQFRDFDGNLLAITPYPETTGFQGPTSPPYTYDSPNSESAYGTKADAAGNLYVASFIEGSIWKMRPEGNIVWSFENDFSELSFEPYAFEGGCLSPDGARWYTPGINDDFGNTTGKIQIRVREWDTENGAMVTEWWYLLDAPGVNNFGGTSDWWAMHPDGTKIIGNSRTNQIVEIDLVGQTARVLVDVLDIPGFYALDVPNSVDFPDNYAVAMHPSGETFAMVFRGIWGNGIDEYHPPGKAEFIKGAVLEFDLDGNFVHHYYPHNDWSAELVDYGGTNSGTYPWGVSWSLDGEYLYYGLGEGGHAMVRQPHLQGTADNDKFFMHFDWVNRDEWLSDMAPYGGASKGDWNEIPAVDDATTMEEVLEVLSNIAFLGHAFLDDITVGRSPGVRGSATIGDRTTRVWSYDTG